MVVFHAAFGTFLIAVNLVVGVWGVLIYRGRLGVGRAFQQVLALSHTVVIGQALIGLLLLGSAHRAPGGLHYVYGFLPVVLIGFAYSARTEEPRRNILVFAIAALVITFLGVRAYTTARGI